MWRRVFIFSIVAFILVTFFTSFNMYWANQIQAKSTIDDTQHKQDLAQAISKVKSYMSATDEKHLEGGRKIALQMTDTEITAILTHILSQLRDPIIASDSFDLKINDNSVISVRGIIVKPIHAPFVVNLVASEHEGQIYFDVYNANVAGLPLGTGVFDRIFTSTFGDNWRTFLNASYISWGDLVVGGGKIYVGGLIK